MTYGDSQANWTDVLIKSNVSAVRGGGIYYTYNGDSDITGISFIDNRSYYGGGMFNTGGNARLYNATFSGNIATSMGGGVYQDSNNEIGVFFSTFSNNQAGGSGGGVYLDSGNISFNSSIVWGNSAPEEPQAFQTGAGIINFFNSIVEGGYPNGDDIITDDPLLGTLGYFVGFTPLIPIHAGSPAIDRAGPENCPAIDQRGAARPYDGDGIPPAACDIGAMEYYPILHATPDGSGDCSSWASACSLQTALSGAVIGNEIWAAAGLHVPGSTRSDTFRLVDNVAVYGGFSGTEESRDARDPAANLTILSGDIDHNDSQTPVLTDPATVTGNTTNSYHIVIGADGAFLDGFTITAGYADGAEPDGRGAGFYNAYSSPIFNEFDLPRK